MYLVWIKKEIKDSFCSINRICDNNDFRNFLNVNGLANTVSDGKELSFGRDDVSVVATTYQNDK